MTQNSERSEELRRLVEKVRAHYPIASYPQALADTYERLLNDLAAAEQERDEWIRYIGRFRGQVRSALSPFWRSNLGVGDEEIITAIERARDAALAHANKETKDA
jgi:hypothetical protein